MENELPKKFEKIVLCWMSRRQKLLYDNYIFAKNTESINIMKTTFMLRKICNHPDLIEEKEFESPLFLENPVYKMFRESIFHKIPKIKIFRTRNQNSFLNLNQFIKLLLVHKFQKWRNLKEFCINLRISQLVSFKIDSFDPSPFVFTQSH